MGTRKLYWCELSRIPKSENPDLGYPALRAE